MKTVAASAERVEAGVWRLTSPIRFVTNRYVRIGFPQRWNMFAPPPSMQRFVRLDHYTRNASGSGPTTVLREIVYPSLPESQFRWHYRPIDKATSTSINNYLTAIGRDETEFPDPEAEEVPGEVHLRPLLRFFRSRLIRSSGGNLAIERTEVWRGASPIPPPGEQVDDAFRERMQDLVEYREGARNGVVQPPYPTAGTTVTESGLTWRLLNVYRP